MSSNVDLTISTEYQENGFPMLVKPLKVSDSALQDSGKLWPSYSDMIRQATAQHHTTKKWV